MVRNDRGNLRADGILFIVLALFIGVAPLVTLLDDMQHAASVLATGFLDSPLLPLLFSLSFYLLWGTTFLVQAGHWNLVNYRRQMAGSWGFAARVPLAAPHPLPNVGALPLPFTITIKPAWPKFVIVLGALVVTSILSDTTAYQNHGLHILSMTDPSELNFFLLPMLTIALIGVFWLLPQRIEITQAGLTVRHSFYDWLETDMRWRYGKRTIRWNEARLFAVRDGKPGAPARHYELSSPYEVVKWQRIRRPHWWSLYRPSIAYAEYDAQMEALIALISGVTGLPLYDAR